MTRVLPLPAPARTSNEPSPAVTASRWAGFRSSRRFPSRLTCRLYPSGRGRPCPLLLVAMEQIERRSPTEPFELRRAERVIELQRLGRAVGVADPALHGLARGHRLQADEADPVVLADAIVVGG